MDPVELERRIDRALNALPAPRAPKTLLPRVMRAVRAASRQRAPVDRWLTWPLAWQAASVAAVLLLVVGAVNVWPLVQAAATGILSESSGGVGSRLGVIVDQIGAIAGAGRVVWRVALQPVIALAATLMVVMFGACALFGSALGKVVLGGTSRI